MIAQDVIPAMRLYMILLEENKNRKEDIVVKFLYH